MAFLYPWGNTQELNLDWILQKIKELERAPIENLTANDVAYDPLENYDIGTVGRDLKNLDSAANYATANIVDLISRMTAAEGAIQSKMPDLACEDLNALDYGFPEIVWYRTTTLNIPTPDRNGICIHFASSANYAVQIAGAVGSEYIYIRKNSGGNWSAWKVYGNTSSDLNHKIVTWNPTTNGKIIFISNSYGRYDVESWQKFPYWCASYLGLGAEGGNWWNVAQPFFSLARENTSSTFKYELEQWVSANPDQLENIGAVVVVGGINDSRPQVSGETYDRWRKVPEKLQELISYIKQTLPNATAYCGYTGWIDLIARPTDDRRGSYRLKVLQAYQESVQYGWKYLNGIENIIHDKNYLDDGVHPNEAGAKRLGVALAQALTTGACEITEWATAIPTAAHNGDTVGSNAKARERQENGIINTQFNAFDFTFATPLEIKAASGAAGLQVIGNINLNMSTGVVEFGNQCVSCIDDSDHTVGLLTRIFITDNGDITFQPKVYFDGTKTKNISRVTSFIISESHAVYADDTWNNTLDSL